MEFLAELRARHESVKRRIHGFRIPIKSRAGRFAVGCFYFCVPILAGYAIMNTTNSIARANLGERGEKLLAIKAARDSSPAAPQPR
jgi:hypothetical protein